MPLNSTKRDRKVRTYPGHSLEETLRVASAIHRKNADLPLNRELLAKELSTTPKSSSFTTILSASKQYGLTEGGYRDQDISLTPLGLAAVASRSIAEKCRSLTIAAYLPSKFKSLREHLQGAPLPAPEFLHGLLTRDLSINTNQTNEYIQIYTANSDFLERQSTPSTEPRSDTPISPANEKEHYNPSSDIYEKGIGILEPPGLSSFSKTLKKLFSTFSIHTEVLKLNEYQADRLRHGKKNAHFVAATILPLIKTGREFPQDASQLSSTFLVGLALGISNGPVIILSQENYLPPDLPPIDPGIKAMIHVLEYNDANGALLDLIKLLANLGILKLSLQ